MAVTCQTPGWRPPGAFFARCGRWPAIPRFLPDARQFVSCCRGAVAISFSRARPQASMVAQALRRFASAKFGLRAIAHAAARELGPLNIHVAHLVIDSSVDTEWVRQTDRSEGRAEGNRQSRSESIDASFRSSRGVLAVVPAAARGVDVRARNETLRREILMSVQWV
jgi:hypothetical protein